MRKRLISALLAVAMVCSIATGCGKETSTGTSTEGSASLEGAELRFLDVSPSPERQAYFEDTFAKFEEETGVKVNYESVPWDGAADKLAVLGASGQLPDVITMHQFWVGQFAAAEWILPLDEYVDNNLADVASTAATLIMENERDQFGHIYRVPDGIAAKGIFYRTDWVEEIGYDIPTGDAWTWDAYFDLMKALRDEEQNRFGNSFRGARGAYDIIQAYMCYRTAGYTYDDEGNYLLNTPESVEDFEKWCSIYLEGYVPEDSLNWGFVEMVDNFTGGLTGTLLNDSEVVSTCLSKMEDSQWGVLPLPVGEDGNIYNQVGSSYAYAVASVSKYPEAAIQLIDFMAKPENNIEYCKMNGLIPVRTDVGNDATYGEDGPYGVFVAQLAQDNLVIPAEYGAFDYTDLHQNMLHTEVQKYLLGQQSAEDVLNNIGTVLTERMKAYLAENEGATVVKPLSLQ